MILEISSIESQWMCTHWKSLINFGSKCILCWTCNEFKFVALQLPVIWILNMKHKMLQILHYILNIKSLGLSKLIAAFTIDQVTWWFPQFEKAYLIHNLPNYYSWKWIYKRKRAQRDVYETASTWYIICKKKKTKTRKHTQIFNSFINHLKKCAKSFSNQFENLNYKYKTNLFWKFNVG